MEILYKRTKTGAIQQWSIQTSSSNDGTWYTYAGQVGGKITEHTKKAKPKNVGKKNATTAREQAQLESEAEWRSKHDEGYKTFEEACGRIVWLTSPSTSELLQHLEIRLPKFNTDALGQAKPMLAKPVNWKKVTYPARVDPKYDGVRCLMVVENPDEDFGGDISVTFLSRSGKEYITLTHIALEVRKHWQVLDSFVLDGEIYSDELTFQEIVAAVKKQSPNSLKLKFRAYDVVNGRKQEERTVMTVDLVETINSSFIEMTEFIYADNRAEVISYHDVCVNEGYEGAMIRLNTGLYEQGFRSSSLMKVKTFDEEEFKLISFFLGERKEDLMANITHGSEVLPVKMTGTTEYKAHLVEEFGLGTPIRGKELIVKYQGLTDAGRLRFPVGKAIRDYE